MPTLPNLLCLLCVPLRMCVLLCWYIFVSSWCLKHLVSSFLTLTCSCLCVWVCLFTLPSTPLIGRIHCIVVVMASLDAPDLPSYQLETICKHLMCQIIRLTANCRRRPPTPTPTSTVTTTATSHHHHHHHHQHQGEIWVSLSSDRLS